MICIIYPQNLEDNIELTKIKIERAEKLISGLGGEKDRWTQVGIYSLKCDQHQAKRTQFFLNFQKYCFNMKHFSLCEICCTITNRYFLLPVSPKPQFKYLGLTSMSHL